MADATPFSGVHGPHLEVGPNIFITNKPFKNHILLKKTSSLTSICTLNYPN